MQSVAKLRSRIRRFVHYCLSEEVPPDVAATLILRYLSRSTNSPDVEEQVRSETRRRGIVTLVHFTPLQNVPSILRFGLIPRHYIQYDSIALQLEPEFTDTVRQDGREDHSCVSVTFPNYRMLFNKRNRTKKKFAVLELSTDAIVLHACYFSNRNSARADADVKTSVTGLRGMFGWNGLRKQIGLPRNYTTDPEAEVLDGSVIPPNWVRRVLVENESDRKQLEAALQKKGVTDATPVETGKNYFAPRFDYTYWQRGSKYSLPYSWDS